MELSELTIEDVRGLISLLKIFGDGRKSGIAAQNTETLIGQCVLVRTYSAGVHVGTLRQKDGTNVLLADSRQLWKWEGAFTLYEVATNGITGGRISCVAPLVELTQAIEIIPMADVAIKAIEVIHE